MSYGILAQFDTPKDILHAAEKIRDAGYKKWDTYTPFPVHGLEKAMGLAPSKMGWIVLVGGALGLSTGFALQTWVATSAYRITVSGKPLFSYQAFVPVIFELMVLFSAFFAVFGMLIVNSLPKHYHPVFHSSNFKKASCDKYFVCIESKDRHFNSESTKALLESVGGKHIEILED